MTAATLLDALMTGALCASAFWFGLRRGRATAPVFTAVRIRIFREDGPQERDLGLGDAMTIVAPPHDPFRFQVVQVGRVRAPDLILNAGVPPNPFAPKPDGGETLQ